MDEQADRIGYALAKQLGSAYALSTNYGELYLDEKMKKAVDKALRPILERQLKRAKGK